MKSFLTGFFIILGLFVFIFALAFLCAWIQTTFGFVFAIIVFIIAMSIFGGLTFNWLSK